MNAMPPKGQMPKGAGLASTAQDSPHDDSIHLTLSVDETESPGKGAGDQPIAQARSAPSDGAAPAEAEARATGRRGGASRPDPLPPQFAAIELSLTVEVGSLSIPLRELMSVEPGQLLALDRLTNEPVSVLVNGKPFARGEIVAVGERYGVRLVEIVAPAGGS